MNVNISDIGNFIKSKSFTVIILAVGSLAVVTSTFSLGMAVGYHKARDSYAWGENYHRTFAGPKDGFMSGFAQDFRGRDFMESGGAYGSVLKIEDGSLVISGRDGSERAVAVSSDTVIRKYRDEISLSGIAVKDAVVVIGDTDSSGAIHAQLIRIMPTPPNTPGGAPQPLIDPR